MRRIQEQKEEELKQSLAEDEVQSDDDHPPAETPLIN
jgi:hypothetical protein